jgi:hypothetical protein
LEIKINEDAIVILVFNVKEMIVSPIALDQPQRHSPTIPSASVRLSPVL